MYNMKHSVKKSLPMRITAFMMMFFILVSSVPIVALADDSPSSAVESISSSSTPESASNSDSVDTESSAAESSSESSSSDSSSSESASSVPESSSSEETSDSTSSSSSSNSDGENGNSESSSNSQDNNASSEPAAEFEFLSLADESSSFDAKIGDTIEMYVKLNRDDVQVTYQWQEMKMPIPETSPLNEEEELYDYGEGESTSYAFLIDGLTEEELLEINPDATWQGIEMYYDQLEKANGDSSKVHIENGTENYILEDVPQEETESLDNDASVNEWEDIEGATENIYSHVVEEDDAFTSYRCVITITDEEYLAKAEEILNAQNNVEDTENDTTVSSNTTNSAANSETFEDNSIPSQEIPADAVVTTVFSSDSMVINLPEEKQNVPQNMGPALFAFSAARSNSAVTLSSDNQWVLNVRPSMEYITEDSYNKYNGQEANNPYWTKINGGTKADGSKYVKTSLTDNTQMEVLSAWYGKKVYFRMQGTSGYDYVIDVPAYTGVNYQTGAKTLYKSAVKILNLWVSDTGGSFYAAYISALTDNSGYIDNGCHITIDKALIDSFNKQPDSYLKNAEGDYIYDLVVVGTQVLAAPDISGAAAWALRDYMTEGYGFMVGHDTMYGYAGVTDSDYVPDKNSTVTPYYTLNTKVNGPWNMNWLMGQNALYTEVSPYDAASMILCLGDYTDKSTMYGDNSGSSTLRITSTIPGDPISDVSVRCPTNFPYSTYQNGAAITQDSTFLGSPTHTNQQLAYGKIWIDYASNSNASIGFGRKVTDEQDGLIGTNNFYLTTNGNFGMSQIGHVKENYNIARIDECRVLANTIMYLSQRQQCQVCQSEQDGNTTIHFVHKINSAEQLEMLKNQEENWFTYPMDGCYMLTSNIVLPNDWTPIEGFYGHFNADGHTVTLTNGQPLFANTSGTLGEYNDSTERGWNLGTDKTTGHNTIYNSSNQRTTGVARVVGYLPALFGTDSSVDWTNKIVVVDGTDGKQYYCTTNADGKYVISNLPCTGIMEAHVYNTDKFENISASNEVTEYGPIRVNVPETFWNTDETTPLYLIGLEPLPVQDVEVYEEQDAILLNGGVKYSKEVTDIKWEYTMNNGIVWNPMDETFNYEISSEFIVGETALDNVTTSTLTIKSADITMDGTLFRAIFTTDVGKSVNTFSARTSGNSGKLTVLPRPLYATNPDNVTIFEGDSAQFISTGQFFKTFDSGLSVDWQYRTVGETDWHELKTNYLLKNAQITNRYETVENENSGLAPYLNISTLDLSNCPANLSNYQFQAVYNYTNALGTTFWESYSDDEATEGREGKLTILSPYITASMSEGQTATITELDSSLPMEEIFSTDTVTYTSDIIFSPENNDGSATINPPSVIWLYKDNINGEYKEWNAETAKAIYPEIEVTISTTEPVPTENEHEFKVTTTMTITNMPLVMDKGTTHYWFIVDAETTGLLNNPHVRSNAADLSISYSIEIHHRIPNVVNNSDNSSTFTYPDLEIVAPAGLRQMQIQFTSGTRDTRDTMVYNSSDIPSNITVTGTPTSGLTFKSTNGELIDTEVWQELARKITFKVYDKETPVYWSINEDFSDAYYNSENGHLYEFVSDPKVSWTTAKTEANKHYNEEIQAVGYLANINSEEENAFVQKILNGKYAWIGGTKDSSYTQNGSTWSWIEGTSSSGESMDYTNWKSGEPDTSNAGKMYAAMNPDGTWSAGRNDGLTQATVRDIAPTWFPTLYMYAPEHTTAAMSLVQGHKYYISCRAGKLGDSNAAVEMRFPAFGITARSSGYQSDLNYDNILTFNGTSGSYTATFANWQYGPDISGLYGRIWHMDLIDLTAAYGAGNEPSLAYCKQNFREMQGSKTVTVQSPDTDKDGYLIEYGVEDNDLLRTQKTAYDTDYVGTNPTYQSTEIIVKVSGEDKIYDGQEQTATVTITKQDGTNIPSSDEELVLQALKLTYSNGKETAIGEGGSECIDAENYGVTVSIIDSTNEIWAKYNIDPIGSITTSDFDILPRGVHLISSGNTKIYDRTTNAMITNITFADPTNDSGIINNDNITLNSTEYEGIYEDYNQTNNQEIKITRKGSSSISLVGEKKDNYYIASETYTGNITPRPLTLHSLYLEKDDTAHNPRNVKAYDDTKEAVISNIIIDNVVAGDAVTTDKTSYAGEYATSEAGETLNKDGTVKDNRLMLLEENPITRTEPISLINDPNGNYFIENEQYSGGIHRLTISVMVSGFTMMYGEKFENTPQTEDSYSATKSGQGTNLEISALVGDDILEIDNEKSYFSMPDVSENTPVGVYEMTYEGLNEENYPVLSNYVVWLGKANVDITPRPLKITVAGGYTKNYLDENPEFEVTYSHQISEDAEGNPIWADGFATEADTPETALTGELIFETDCTKTSPVKFAEDGSIDKYYIYASGLTSKTNRNGMQNYEIEWQYGDITVQPRDITLIIHDKEKIYGDGDPELTFDVYDPKTDKTYPWTDNDNPFKDFLETPIRREPGEDSGNYEIGFDPMPNPNFTIKIETGTLKIVPAQLIIKVNGGYRKAYGAKNPEFTVSYIGFKRGDSKDASLHGVLQFDTESGPSAPRGRYVVHAYGLWPRLGSQGQPNYTILWQDGDIVVGIPKTDDIIYTALKIAIPVLALSSVAMIVLIIKRKKKKEDK